MAIDSLDALEWLRKHPRGWREFDGGNGHALVEAADDLLRWMGRVAEIASSACERCRRTRLRVSLSAADVV